MLVGDVLNLVGQLSIGLDSPTADDSAIWLNYLKIKDNIYIFFLKGECLNKLFLFYK